VLAVRKQWRPVPGTVGNLIDGTECQIRAEDGSVLPPGAQGVVFVRGPQVMKGYYNRPDLTSQVLSADGWLNTGDLGMLTHGNELKITGRAKDTIVLRGGENVEPLPIEHKLKESELIDQAIVLGQDQKFLGALIVPNAEALLEALEAEGATGGGAPAAAGSPGAERESAGGGAGVATAPTQTAAEAGPGADPTLEQLVNDPRVRRLIEREINELVSARTGFRGFELIIRFRLVADQFQTGKELSAKQEVKRHVINEQYSQLISEMFA
jgi:long-chain acyl-CoA synthetase